MFVVVIVIVLILITVWQNSINDRTANISKDEEYLGKEGKYKENFGHYNNVFPNEIPESADVKKFYYRYYNPWDPCYLGYLVYTCDEEDYRKEYERLSEIRTSKNMYIYGAESFSYDLCAVYADPDHGYIYALADEENMRFIYIELQFCNGFTDINYRKIIDEVYLPEGFDAT